MVRRGNDRPPRVGAAMFIRALLGVLTVFVAIGVGVAAAGYFQIPVPPHQPPIPHHPRVTPPQPDGPRTLLVLGSDRRAATSLDGRQGSAETPHSDTILLIRLDPDRNRVAVLSLPRDLAVRIPGYGDDHKINEAYDLGGAAKTLETVQALFKDATGRKLAVNGVIDASFNGFQRAVNELGGVYVDVDRAYHNEAGSGYAAIDLEPGYQRLVGSDALAYVRYRHTDSDLFRNARQQEFLRQATHQPAVGRLKDFGAARGFVDDIVGYFQFDKEFMSRRNSAGMIKTALSLALGHAPVNQIALHGITEAPDPLADTRLRISDANLRAAYDAFLTGRRGARNPRKPATAPRARTTTTTGLENARAAGEDQAVVAASKLGSLPFYFPTLRLAGSTSPGARVYTDRDPGGTPYRAYRIVLATGRTGEFYGVQGMTWKDPPLLAAPDETRSVGGRSLALYYDGRALRQVAWRTPRGSYYVTNTLNRALSNQQMLAIAGSLRRLR